MRSHFWRSRGMKALCLAIALLIAAELVLQTRAHLRFGRSVFNAASGETTFVDNHEYGLRLYRANAVIEGANARIETNSVGLRSPEVEGAPMPGEIRIAVVGASSVAGAYAPTNADTFSYILAELLRAHYPGRIVNVINAGIPGNAMDQHYRMIERLVIPLRPSLIVFYPGQNDFRGYCGGGEQAETAQAGFALPALELPSWMLSQELLVKNTVWVRHVPAGRSDTVPIEEVDPSGYRAGAERIVDLVREAGIGLLMTDNARAYRREMSLSEQLRLSETARFYNPCFELDALHDLADLHNETLREVAAAGGAHFLALSRAMPGGDDYFVDASHFSLQGERLVARLLFEYIVEHDLTEAPDATTS